MRSAGPVMVSSSMARSRYPRARARNHAAGRLAGMAGLDEARSKGATAVGAVKVSLAERAAELLRRDPELTDTAVEVGLVDRAWLEEPGHHPVRTAPALDVVQRFLERSVERRPSALGAIGLNALQLLAYDHPAAAGDPAPSPVAVVFTDLEGFTRYTARRGDEAARHLLAEHHRVVGPVGPQPGRQGRQAPG